MKEIVIKLFDHDLKNLKIEISSFKEEKKIWDISGEIKNSAGNLCIHVCGNLQHFIGAVLGNSGYVRKRDEEFSRKILPLQEMIIEIDETIRVVKKTLSELNEDKLNKTFPVNVFGYEMSTGFFLVHLATHLSYHLGQINYHRRLLDE